MIEYKIETIDLKKEAEKLILNVNKDIDSHGYKEIESLKSYIESQPKNTYEDAKKYNCGYGILRTLSHLILYPSIHYLCVSSEESQDQFFYNRNDWIRNIAKRIIHGEIGLEEIIFEYNRNIKEIVDFIFSY